MTNFLVTPGIGIYMSARIISSESYEKAYNEAMRFADTMGGDIRKITDDEKMAALKLGATEIKV